MRDLIVNKAPWFALGWLGCVVAGTGLGALAISSGTPLMVVVYTQLALQVTLALAIAVGVRERVAGLVAVAMTTVLPFGAFISWAEVTLSKKAPAAAFVVAFGAALVCVAGWRSLTAASRTERGRALAAADFSQARR